MRAVIAHGTRDFRLEDVPQPVAGGGAVIRVEASGVCAADRMIYRGDSPWQLSFPFVPGHEFVGTIVEVAPEAAERWQVQENDLVTAEVLVPCEGCRYCASGRYHLCRSGTHLGSGLAGGWAEYMRLPSGARLWKLPSGLDASHAVLTEPLSCGIYAVERAEIGAADSVVVAGIGAIGAGALAAAAQHRPQLLVALVTSNERADLAQDLGADAVINVREDDSDEKLVELTGGLGPDVYIDTSGSVSSVELGLEVLTAGGRLVVYGVYATRGSIDWNQVAEFKELEIRGGHLSPGAFPRAIEMLSTGAIHPERLVTHRKPLDLFHEAIEPSDGRLRVKAILEPHAQAATSGSAAPFEKEQT